MNPLPLRSGGFTVNWSNSREQELSKLRQEISKQTKIVNSDPNASNASNAIQPYFSKETTKEAISAKQILDSSEHQIDTNVVREPDIGTDAEQNQQILNKGEAVAKLGEIERRIASLEAQRQEVIARLSSRDLEVRQHEEAHVRVGQELAGTPSYQTVTGPDGKRYIVNGEVPIDVSAGKDPTETMQKMLKVMRAALAPAEPSPADHQVYSLAQANYNEARALKAQLDAKIAQENFERAKALATQKSSEQEDYAIKTDKLGKIAIDEAIENKEAERTDFVIGKKRNKVLAVLQKMELFGMKNLSAQDTIKKHFEWSSTLSLPKSYSAGELLDVAA